MKIWRTSFLTIISFCFLFFPYMAQAERGWWEEFEEALSKEIDSVFEGESEQTSKEETPSEAKDKQPHRKSAGLPESRSFHLGIGALPYGWPYLYSENALNDTIKIAHRHADLIMHHLDYGVPWPEALEGKKYHPAVEKDLNTRASKRKRGQKIYVAIAPQQSERTKLASYWGGPAYETKPLPGRWRNKKFDDPEVIEAYLNYARDIIKRFQPDYLAYGIECTDTFKGVNDHEFKRFLVFAKEVYTTLKEENPDLPLFCTTATFLFDEHEKMDRLLRLGEKMLPYNDIIAISTYPYWKYRYPGTRTEANPRNIPRNWFSQWADLDRSKPFAISETAYPAEDMIMRSWHVDVKGSEQWQADYVQQLFEELNRLDAEFVAWFTPKDYDYAWEIMEGEGENEIIKLWKDVGLLDGEGRARPALKLWDQWLKVPKRDVNRAAQRPRPSVVKEKQAEVEPDRRPVPYDKTNFSLNDFNGIEGTIDVNRTGSTLEWTYKFSTTKFPILLLWEPSFEDLKGLEIRVRSEKTTSMAFVLNEKGDIRYDYHAYLPARQWKTFRLPWNEFKVQDETPDPNGRLDLNNIESFSFFDLGAFDGNRGKNTITIEYVKEL